MKTKHERLHSSYQRPPAGQLTSRPKCISLPPLRLQPQQQVSQLGAPAGKARLGSLAHPPPLADFLGTRAHVVAPVHYLLEQLSGHARIG